MAIPGAGEIVPGMNTQARKPAFEPKPDISPIPMQPAPIQQPKTIREYLQALQPGQVPTFTNIPGGGAFAGQEGVAEFGAIAPGGAGEMIPYPQPGQQGAIPEGPAGDPADRPITGSNPYDMAMQRLEQMMPEMEQQFTEWAANRYSLQEHNEKFAEYVRMMANNLVKKYEKKVQKAEADGLKLLKNYSPESIKIYQRTGDIADLEQRWDWRETYEKALKEYDKLTEYDPIRESMTAEEYGQSRVRAMEAEIQRRREEQRMLEQRGQEGAGRGAMPQLTPEQQEEVDLYKRLRDGTAFKPDKDGRRKKMSEEQAKDTIEAWKRAGRPSFTGAPGGATGSW